MVSAGQCLELLVVSAGLPVATVAVAAATAGSHEAATSEAEVVRRTWVSP